MQPYRELRRLWGKSAVDVEGTTIVYRLAPAIAAAAVASAVLIVPVASVAPDLGSATTCSRSPACSRSPGSCSRAASWDTANGFSLMGASRDLTLSVFVEGTLVLAVGVAALVSGTTDLVGMVAATAGGDVVVEPGAPARRARRSRSSWSPRRDASRSTTPTRTSS